MSLTLFSGILNFCVYLHRDTKIKKCCRRLCLGVRKLLVFLPPPSSDDPASEMPPAGESATGNPSVPVENLGSKVSRRIPSVSKKTTSAIEAWASSHLPEPERSAAFEQGGLEHLGEGGNNAGVEYSDEPTSDDLSLDEEELYAGVREYWEVTDKLTRRTGNIGVTNQDQGGNSPGLSLSERLARSFNFIRGFDERDDDEEDDDDSEDVSDKRMRNSGTLFRTFRFRFAKSAPEVTSKAETERFRGVFSSEHLDRSYHGLTAHQRSSILKKDQAGTNELGELSTNSLGW